MRFRFTRLVALVAAVLMISAPGGSGAALAAGVTPIVNGDGMIETVFGNGASLPFGASDLGKAATQVPLSNGLHSGLAVGPDGTLYVSMPSRVVKVGPDGIVRPVVGICAAGHPRYPACVNTSTGDGGPALAATVSSDVRGLALGADGSLYIADRYRIRRVSPDGIIATAAGGDEDGFSGDGGPAMEARFGKGVSVITDVDVADDGTLYITDNGNNRIRKVDTNGIVSTVAGKDGPAPNCWDIPASGSATDVYLFSPQTLTIGPDGALYVSNYSCAAVRRIANGASTLLIEGFDDNNDGIAFSINQGNGIAFGSDGTLYLTHYYGNSNNVLLARAPGDTSSKLTPGHLVAGQVGFGYHFSGDGGLAKNAELAAPSTLASGPDGSIYVLDALNYRIRRIGTRYSSVVNPASGGAVSTAGNGIVARFPAGAVDMPIDVLLSTSGRPTYPISVLRPTRHLFSLVGSSNGAPVTRFNKLYSLTINYRDSDLRGVGITDEARLNLYFWNGARWQPLLPCSGCALDTASNQVTVALDHFSDFALMEPAGQVYIPFVSR